jgi:dipeptidyl aminopeptidase/acylaminoacyl peptidase
MKLQNFNFLSFEMAHFKQEYQKLIGPIDFVYQGDISDPYPNFLKQAAQQLPADKLIPNLYYRQDKPDSLPMTLFDELSSTEAVENKYPLLKNYFQYDSQSIRSVSPDQSLLLFSAVNSQVVTVGLIGVENFETYLLYQQKLPINTSVSELLWVDNDSFFLTLSNSGQDRSYVAHLDFDEQSNTIKASFIKFRYEGELIDGLSQENNQVFFELKNKAGSRKNNFLYQVDVTDENSIDNSFKKIYKNTKKLNNPVDWLIDKSGQVRAALTVDYDKKDDETSLEYWFLADAKSNDWRMIKSEKDADSLYWFLALSDDESYFMVLTNEFSDKYAVHKYATTDGSHLGLLYEDPNHDIRNLLIDPADQQVIGYTYFENGVLQAEYLIALDEKFDQARLSNPDLQLFQVQNLAAQNRLLLYGMTPNSKGAWYLLNTDTGLADKIFDTSPSYEQLPKGQYNVLHTQAEDGVELEGFLVMPELIQGTKAPLIVMPHGGPIGVRDFAHNNEMQHFLATQGFATLKVNYRGSGGYGKAFEALGKQQWGEKIEQDIFSMTQHAINNYAVDSEKICAMGGSYGGYSALMLTYLYPETYLCAISFAGVMDLPLLFTSKDLSKQPYLQEKLTEIVGDPSTEIDKLVNKSPLYLLKDMQRPLLLFQGQNDSRVHVEHVLRMQQLISLFEMDHEVVLFTDEGHSFSQKNTVKLYLDQSIKFIKKHLQID